MEGNKLNTGVLFPNNKKENERQPDYRGSVNVDGKEYELSVWKKTSQRGSPYMSIAVKEPWNKDASSPSGTWEKADRSDSMPKFGGKDDDLPF